MPKRPKPQAIRKLPEITISFSPQELQFLVQALRDLPVSGTPDNLAQALPLIQGIRLKFATALQVVASGGPPEAASPPAKPPTE